MPLKLKRKKRVVPTAPPPQEPPVPVPEKLPYKEADTHCNARRLGGTAYCKNSAGAGTDHLGVGRCQKHERGRKRKLVHGWASKLTHTRVKEILDELSTVEMNVMDLIPEANLLRALTVDYINRYDEFVDALMAWYEDPDNKMRPRRVMDIHDAAQLVESISRVVQRMHQIQSEGAISLETFRRVTELMGVIVARHVKTPATLNAIEREWMDLALDAKAPPTTSVTEEE